MKPTSPPDGEVASAKITKRIQELEDWRGEGSSATIKVRTARQTG
jgi:hypothetical protein